MVYKVRGIIRSGSLARIVELEISVSERGLPSFDILGVPRGFARDTAIVVKTALINSGFKFPKHKILVNMNSKYTPTEKGSLDFPICAGLVSHILGLNYPKDIVFFGNLTLSGSVYTTENSLLPQLFSLKSSEDISDLVVPEYLDINLPSLLSSTRVFRLSHIKELADLQQKIETLRISETLDNNLSGKDFTNKRLDVVREVYQNVSGNKYAKRALQIAAAGGHSMIFIGPPGSGKTIFSDCLSNLLADLDALSSAEVFGIYSQASDSRSYNTSEYYRPPVVKLNHNAKKVDLLGGGKIFRYGAVSLAHRGVLILDDISAYKKDILDSIITVLEEGGVYLRRNGYIDFLPAKFQLICTSRPCPCGYYGIPESICKCSRDKVAKFKESYLRSLLDKVNLIVELVSNSSRSNTEEHLFKEDTFNIDDYYKDVCKAIEFQRLRYPDVSRGLNSSDYRGFISNDLVLKAKNVCTKFQVSFNLSSELLCDLLSIARTIADLSGVESIDENHIVEALHFKKLL